MELPPGSFGRKMMSATGSCAVSATLFRAIQIERRNGAIYDSLASVFQGYDASVEAIFQEMAAEERQHGTLLEQTYRNRFGFVPTSNKEPKEVIEGPDLEDSEALIFDSMSVEQALEMGLRAEQGAREFYRQETLRTSDPQLQTMFRELSEFEEEHVRILQVKLEEKRRAGGTASR
jgi:rubrerythrin